MYEACTYDYLLNRMLDRVPSSIDKREGSVIYAALAPAAAELAQLYADMDVNLRLGFASTSSGEYLALRAAEMGIERKPATKAKRKGLFFASGEVPVDVPLGSRFTADSLNYIVLGKLEAGAFTLECETAGEVGNSPVGAMLPIDYIPGLSQANLTDILEEGTDEESDEKLLEEYRIRVRQPATSGNSYQYRQWAMEVSGVGDAKIFPLWDGPGTVKVVIVDTERQPAQAGLVSEAAAFIEEVRPIGAAVTVVSGSGKAMNVSATVALASGYTLQSVSDAFTAAFSDYLKSIAFSLSYVSYARVGTLLLSIPGVLDYTTLTFNGNTANVALLNEEIPVIGTVDLEV